KCLHISTAFASHFAAPHHIDPARSVGFSTKQRRTPAVAAARMDWVMSPSSGDALLYFVKRAVPAGSKCTNWYRQSSGCCGGVVTQAYGQPDNPVSSTGKE
ncbi:hypothetical protein, partial [Escherichia coli]|uniref:hypothetical protein n=2 Tax=Escherichia coli TaxID=562 RepID=UPI002896DCF8